MEVAVAEVRRGLQEGSLAGDVERGRYCRRNRRLELGTREELLGLKNGKTT